MSISGSGFSSITCPACHRNVTPGAKHCHFCGSDFETGYTRPTLYQGGSRASNRALTMYKVAGGFWIANAAYTILTFLLLFSARLPSIIPDLVRHLSVIFIAVACLLQLAFATVALGMLLDSPWARSWARILGWIGLIFCPLGLFVTIVRPRASGFVHELTIVRLLIVMAMSVVTIWAVKETS
jgi:hypothetical protein